MLNKAVSTLVIIAIIVCVSFACDEMHPLTILNQIEIEPVEVTGMTEKAWATMDFFLQNWGTPTWPPYESLTEEDKRIYDELREKEEIRKMDQKAFYNRSIDADGMTIIGNDATLDVHFQGARKVLLLMTAKRPELRDAFKDGYYHIIAGGTKDVQITRGYGYPQLYFDVTRADLAHLSSLPEFSRQGFHLGTGIVIAGGLSPQVAKPRPAPVIMLGWTANLAVDGPSKVLRSSMKTLVHEFAHAIEWALKFYDPEFPSKLEHAFENAKEKGLWNYPGVSRRHVQHFWTGIIEIWFYHIGPDVPPYQNRFETVEDYIAYDPVVGELMQEWFYHYPFQELLSPEGLGISLPEY